MSEAKRYLKECMEHLEMCKMINDSLEGILEQKLKPSEELEPVWKSK